LDSLPNPNLPENLLKTSGRGVYFMKQVMDTVEMRHTNEGSTLVLVKNRRHAEVVEG
jgi:serine/threonine-protein kinase RsbW